MADRVGVFCRVGRPCFRVRKRTLSECCAMHVLQLDVAVTGVDRLAVTQIIIKTRIRILYLNDHVKAVKLSGLRQSSSNHE